MQEIIITEDNRRAAAISRPLLHFAIDLGEPGVGAPGNKVRVSNSSLRTATASCVKHMLRSR